MTPKMDHELGCSTMEIKVDASDAVPVEGTVTNTVYVDPDAEKSLVRKLDFYLLPILAVM